MSVNRKRAEIAFWVFVFALLFFFWSVLSWANKAAAADLSGVNGSIFNMTLSSENPNMIAVKGDKITGVTSKGATLLELDKLSNGSITVVPGGEQRFSMLVETSKGNNYVLNVTPRKGLAASYIIHRNDPEQNKSVTSWEQRTAYESLLLSVNESLARGEHPKNYELINNKLTDISWAGLPFKMTRSALYGGGAIAIERYTMTNTGSTSLTLNESDFSRAGVRSVMFKPDAKTLLAGGRQEVIIISDVGVIDVRR